MLDHIEQPAVTVGPIGEPEYKLRDLVGGISEENRHREVDWTAPIGREWAWRSLDPNPYPGRHV